MHSETTRTSDFPKVGKNETEPSNHWKIAQSEPAPAFKADEPDKRRLHSSRVIQSVHTKKYKLFTRNTLQI